MTPSGLMAVTHAFRSVGCGGCGFCKPLGHLSPPQTVAGRFSLAPISRAASRTATHLPLGVGWAPPELLNGSFCSPRSATGISRQVKERPTGLPCCRLHWDLALWNVPGCIARFLLLFFSACTAPPTTSLATTSACVCAAAFDFNRTFKRNVK